ncbi:LicD family protein [Thermodesulfobacteriota bacterium]
MVDQVLMNIILNYKLLNKLDMADVRFFDQQHRENTLIILKKVSDVLHEHNIVHYLDFGTLIGAIREKGFIPWDDDIDISLAHEKDYHKIPLVLKKIKKRFRLRTYLYSFKESIARRRKGGEEIFCETVNFTDENNYQIAKVRDNWFWIVGRGNVCIDIFFKYKFKDNMYWMAYGKENFVPSDRLGTEFVEIDFYDLKFKIPKQYNEYLTYKYGDWMTRNEKWTHDNDDFTIVNSY